MSFDYINEAFRRLDVLDEQMFNASNDGINELTRFIYDGDEDTDVSVRVVDPNAESVDELESSYVGKVILNCNICHSHIFTDKADIQIEDDTVNPEQSCPCCNEMGGFTIVGEIAPYGAADAEKDPNPSEQEISTAEDDEMPVEETTDDNPVVEESMSKATQRVISKETLSEDFKEVSITTEDQHLEMTSDENGKVTVTTEPIETTETTEEVIAPISAETESEVLANNDIVAEEPEAEEFDFEFDDIDEDGLDELGENYFNRVYENVQSFKTTSVAANDSNLIVEGIITFKSGTQKNTGFIFEAKDVNTKGQVRFCGRNKHLAESMDAFSLIGTIDNKKLFVESLKYNYTVDSNTVRGVVRRK